MARNILTLFVYITSILVSSAQVSIEETAVENRPHFKVKAGKSIWYIDKYSGGVSGLTDKDGNDWVGWKRLYEEKYPESAAGDFRGMPNLVFGGEDNGTGHPGFNKVMCFKINHRQLSVKSLNGKWEWIYTFYPKYTELQILKIPDNRNYWFLYEGTPGGEFNPKVQYWGTETGIQKLIPDYYKGKEVYNFWQWVFFGHQNVDRILFFVQRHKDDLKDTFGYLGNSENGVQSSDGMVVFGFGRDKKATPLLRQKNTFYIGFFENKVDDKTFPDLEKFIQKNFY